MIVVLFTTLTMLFAQLALSAQQEKVVATLNGQLILLSDVQKALGKKSDTPANRERALNGIIDDLLVQKAIKESGVTITKAQIDRAFQQVADSNGLTWGQLLDVLDYQGIGEQQYRNQIAHQMLMGQVKQISIGKSIDVDPQDVLKLSDQLITEAQTKGNVKKVMGTEYLVRHILLKTNPILTDAKAKKQLDQIREDILAKRTTFEEQAKMQSKDYLSGYKGGLLDWAFPEVYTENFAKMIKSTPKNRISQPFKSEFGWHILEVVDTRQGDKTKDYYLQKAYEQIINRQAQAASADWVAALRKQADIKIYP